MRRPFAALAILAALLLLAVALRPSGAPPMGNAPSSSLDAAAPFHSTMAKRWGLPIPSADPIPEGLTPRQRADYVLNERIVDGRTPAQWLDLARSYRTDGARGVPPATARLDLAVLQVYQAVGVAPSVQDLAAARLNAASVPLPLQAPVADLLATVAQAYAEQAPIAKDVRDRIASSASSDGIPFQPAQRDATAERAGRIMDAIGLFHARWDALAPLDARVSDATCLVPVVTTSDCLAYMGSPGDDEYDANAPPLPDPILIIDPDGNDTYRGSAGGANPTGEPPEPGIADGNGLALSVVFDQYGNDLYAYDGPPSVVQGGGTNGALGILVDEWSDDTYEANFTRGSETSGGSGPNQDGGAQGFGYSGFGLLVDEWGDDTYDARIVSTQGACIFGYAQGWGGVGGVGIASDLWGNDLWRGWGDSTASFDATGCFVGVYNHGSGLAGVGILTDTGKGNDVYADWLNATATDFYAQGYGAIGGLGILYEDGGNDRYVAEEHSATYAPLNCAFGTGSLAGVGILVDEAGNDSYRADTTSPNGGVTMVEGAGDLGASYGLFIDRDGTDDHEAYASTSGGGFVGVFGRGVIDTTNLSYNVAGTYLDLGGANDTYVPLIASLGGTATNDNEWVAGLDDG